IKASNCSRSSWVRASNAKSMRGRLSTDVPPRPCWPGDRPREHRAAGRTKPRPSPYLLAGSGGGRGSWHAGNCCLEAMTLTGQTGQAATRGAAVRGVTYAIKHHIPPFHDIEVGNTHLHHYVWGIGLLSGAGGVAVYGDGNVRCHPVVGAVYGAGLGLVVDELALLLELRDVYWQRQGRW